MEAIELLNELEDQGLSLKAKRDRLLVMPSKKITELTRSLIRQNKAELLRLIKPATVSGYQIGQLKCLYYPPGISAADLLVAIKPRSKTYLGLTRETISPQKQLKIFSDKLEVGLKNEKTIYHKALSRSERKELTLLSMILIPRNWTIENRRMTEIVRPPEEAEKMRVELERMQKTDTSGRIARR